MFKIYGSWSLEERVRGEPGGMIQMHWGLSWHLLLGLVWGPVRMAHSWRCDLRWRGKPDKDHCRPLSWRSGHPDSPQ